MSNDANILSGKSVEGLSPTLYPAAIIAPSTHLQCGLCGCCREVEFYVYSSGTNPFEAVCDCPLDATLLA